MWFKKSRDKIKDESPDSHLSPFQRVKAKDSKSTIRTAEEYHNMNKPPYMSDEEVAKSIDEYISYWVEKGDNYVTYSDNPNKKYVYYYNYILNHLEEFKSKGFVVCIEPSNENYPHNTIALIWGDVSEEYAFQSGVFKKEL